MSRKIAASALALTLALDSTSIAYATVASPAGVAMDGREKVLVDGDGWTLYTFDKDQHGESECTFLCAAAWPPLAAPAGARAHGPWSLIRRSSGTLQWAYNGSPLYTYRLDFSRGEVSGNGADGGLWHVAKP